MVLHGITNEVGFEKIIEIACMSRADFREALSELKSNGYIEAKGVSVFASYKLTDWGVQAWKTHSVVYEKDGDVERFEIEIEKYLSEEVKKKDVFQREG